MEEVFRSDRSSVSHKYHLSPSQDFYTSAKPEQRKIRRKPVSSDLPQKPYHAIKVNEELDKAQTAGSDTENEPCVNKDWPSEPQCLDEWTWMRYTILGADIIQTCLPLIFLILGISALALDRKPLSSFGDNIIAGTKIGPTIFPIIFAAVVSRLMRSIAHWKAEKGTQLGMLEQLIGSQNLTGAVQRMVLLRNYGPLGFAIVVLWLLSPLGGQSTLRLLNVSPSAVPSERQLHYFNVNYTAGTVFTGANYLYTMGASVSALFQASVLASVQAKSSPVDLWNNVKIPMIDELSPWTEEIPGNPWIAINQSGSKPVYASLSGLNINGLPELGESAFSIETSYMQLKCGDGIFYPKNDTDNDGPYAYVFPDGLQWNNASSPFVVPNSYYGANGTSSLFVDTSYPRVPSENNTVPLNLLYGSQLDQRTSYMTLYNCTVGTARVEAAISCQGASCKVVNMRRSIFDTRSPLIVPFAGSAFQIFCGFLPFATGPTRSARTAPLDYYLLGSDSPFAPENTSASFADVSGDLFAKRLSTLINTLWQASLAPSSLGLGTLAPWNDNTSDAIPGNNEYMANSTTARVNTPVQVYHAERAYVGIVIVVAFLLEVCAVVGLTLKYMTLSPDILGYVSTQTCDNPHVEVPTGGNALDGLERARFLKKMKVQIGDVRWEEPEAGHVAFRSVRREEEWVLGRVKKEKQYI